MNPLCFQTELGSSPAGSPFIDLGTDLSETISRKVFVWPENNKTSLWDPSRLLNTKDLFFYLSHQNSNLFLLITTFNKNGRKPKKKKKDFVCHFHPTIPTANNDTLNHIKE